MARMYLDNCCLSRLFDESEQERIRIEAEAIRAIFDLIRTGQVTWVSSPALLEECLQNSNLEARLLSESRLENMSVKVTIEPHDLVMARKFQQMGMGSADALHMAVAEKGRCEALLTTDDKFIKKAAIAGKALDVIVMNPVDWVRRRSHDTT